MKGILLILAASLAMPVFAQDSGAGDTRSQLKKLYYQINSSDDPHTDGDVKANVKRLVHKSCFESAKKALKRRSISKDQKSKILTMMDSTCTCIAKSDDMTYGVIDSAKLFKAHGKHSEEARQAMSNGMKKAKAKCFNKMRQQMQHH